MRFKLFGNKGSLNTTETKKEKKKKKDKDDNAIVCTGFRFNSEFDTPSRLRTTTLPSSTTLNDQESSSLANGNITNVNNTTLRPPQVPPKGILVTSKSKENLNEIKQDSSSIPTNTYQNIRSNSPEVVLRPKRDFNYYENEDAQIKIVTGKAVAAPAASPTITVETTAPPTIVLHQDDGKKSTLIHMTESDDDVRRQYDNDDEHYEELEDRHEVEYNNNNGNVKNEYSSEAASIFFGGSDSEPPSVQRKRNIKYRDDDDNGSQTSA